MTRSHSALVVGGGVFGLSIARELARRGRRVTLVDRQSPGHAVPAGPSTAESRILRCSYGTRQWYSAMAHASARHWRDLEKEAGRELLVPCGVIGFASRAPSEPADADGELASLAALRELGIPVEKLTPQSVARRFPGVADVDLDFAVYEPESGVLRAREAVRALAESAQRYGCRMLRGTARPDGAGVRIDDAETYTADVVVWTVGAALPDLFPGLTSARAAHQVSYYLDSTAMPCAPGGPAWIDRRRGLYGVGALSARGVKVVPDVETPVGAPAPAARPELPATARSYLRGRFPALAAAPVATAETCAYAAMEDEEFLVGRHPAHEHVWLVGGDSGHGFKNAPTWGKYVCDVMDGTTTVHSRWRLR
ncbi:FAD-dependent oxidoreductase [Streptomyces sp. SR27]|uniref:FAD-dependent oxidoreductase n=1 Tax=Streptomyces sp. SR27 TaxID=3076630 RepID=UPI00295BE9A5|nr:FAD-dependent oxidoreductase [Streptomyces sp. SR27]MDV9189687.1 FAD-dependent oxidoreductase [Streptomyces sp. SR27]